MSEYKLFPGCVIQNRVPFLEASAKYVFDKLGVAYSSGEFGCCPNPVGIKMADKKTWCALAARNIAEAEKEEKPIMALCNGCYQSLAVGNHELKHDPVLKKDINAILKKVDKEYKGIIDINHFVTVLVEEVGLDKIKSMITNPLEGLKVGVHPGCHYARPSHILNNEDPMDPHYLKDLVEVAGAEVVDYDLEMLCCGNSVRNQDEYTANTMLRDKIRAAKESGADCLAVNCPACFQQFENNQLKLRKMKDADKKEKFRFPTLFITEILALAMGKDAKEIGIRYHRNKSREFLNKVSN